MLNCCRICQSLAEDSASGLCAGCEAQVNGVQEANGVLLQQAPQPPQAQSTSPLALIEQAIQKGFDAEQLGKLMDLQDRFELREAAKAFAAAVTGFQAECPPVFKSRTASVPSKSGGAGFQYGYASLDDVMRVARPHLQKWGITVKFDTEASTDGRRLKVTCKITVGTHSEPTTVNLPIPPATTNDVQAFASAVSYGKRYALCAALNIVVTDEDDDAALLDFITETEAQEITALLQALKTPLPQFFKWAKVPIEADARPVYADVKKIRNTEAARILDELRRRKRAQDAQPAEGGYS